MFLFGNHLQQDTARNVGVVFLVDDYEVYSFDDQAPYIRQRYIPALNGVVESSVWIFLNHSRIAHGAPRSCLAERATGGCRYVPDTNDLSVDITKDNAMQREGKS
jgi:hypothetical protein